MIKNVNSDELDTFVIEDLVKVLQTKRLYISTCESCTGGWVAKLLTDRAGSSEYYSGGLVTYTNALKQSLVGVQEATLMQFGAVSEAVAAEMAEGCRKACNSDIGIATTGIAGPGGGSIEKPVGQVCFGWDFVVDGVQTYQTQTKYFSGQRADIREQSARYVLMQLLNLLEK